MILPDYENSIVNLMSSISNAYNKKHPYKKLKILDNYQLKKSKNIILLVIDGLGYEFLKNNFKESFLNKNTISKITSVFPSTTASAITTFKTALPPNQTAITGWFMNLKELGSVCAILPFTPRFGLIPIDLFNYNIKNIIDTKSFFSKINCNKYIISETNINNSAYNNYFKNNAKLVNYNTLNGMFMQIKKTINKDKNKKYIYAYWSLFDSLSHHFGSNSKDVKKHFLALDKKIKSFTNSIKNTNTTLIITADHGFIDTNKNKVIWLEDYPKIKECLTMPLCGEPRVIYCYVKSNKTKEFEKLVKNKLNKFCNIYKSSDLIKKNYFGLFIENEKLIDRIGDYTLIMKENYILKDKLLDEKKGFEIGNHGGISKEEMYVPLFVKNC